MFLRETWLNMTAPAALIESSPPNYSFSYSIRKGKSRGGTATILKESFGFKNIDFGDFTSFENNSIVFSSPPLLCVCVCVCVYRPPKHCSSFIPEFSEILSTATHMTVLLF